MKVVREQKGSFSRKKSVESIGQLYPILLAKDGQVIDGFHRKEEDPGWRTETLDHIDTPEKLLLARAASNWHRRYVSWQEKRDWVNELAQLYLDQGLKVSGSKNKEGGRGANEIMNKIVEELGVCRQTVTTYLHARYKQAGKGGNQGGPRVPASQSIRTIAKSRPRLAGNLVERHREEVRKELLHCPAFRKEMRLQIEKEALAMEDEDDPDPEALTTMNFNNLVHRHQDGLRQIASNPTLNPFIRKESNSLKKWGVIEMRYSTLRKFTLTPEAEKVLLSIEG